MHQEVIKFGTSEHLLGILTIPENYDFSSHSMFIILNAGLLHRVGPNRMSTKLAFKLCEQDIASFRFDFSGIGDSENSSETYIKDNPLEDTLSALDYLSESYGVKKFVLFGICSGAGIAIKVSLENKNVTGLCLVNGNGVDIHEIGLDYATIKKYTTSRYYAKSILSMNRWINLIRKSRFLYLRELLKKIVSRILGNLKFINSSQQFKQLKPTKINNWDLLIKKGISILYILSEGSSSLDIYNLADKPIIEKTIKNREKISLEIIKGVDHNFTPVWSQILLIDNILKWTGKV